MSILSSNPVRRAPWLVQRALLAGLVVGVLDGLYVIVVYAWVKNVTTSARIFQNIARALLGPAAVEGGAATVLLGLAMHFGVALGWSLAYALLYRRWWALQRLTRSTGGALGVAVVYGTLVWVAMSQLIVPLTQNQGTPLFTAAWFTIWAAHLTCVGPPITLLVRLRR